MMVLASGTGVYLSNHTLNAVDHEFGSPTAAASARFELNTDGKAYAVMTGNLSSPTEGTTAYANEWFPGGLAASYDCFATLNSGTLSGGTTGSWLNLGTTRSWTCSATKGTTGTSTQSANLTVQIRDATSLTVLASATISLYAEANFDA